MSDVHLPADGELLWGEDCRRKFLTAVGQIKEMQDIHAIIVSGDISNDGNIDSYIYADQVFAELNIPTYWCAGNHDNLSVLSTTFKPKFCRLDGQIKIGNWRLYLINSVIIDTDDPSRNCSSGLVTAKIRKELNEQLSKNPEPTIIVLHHPPLEIGGWQDNKILKERETFREMLCQHENVRLVLSGHVHDFSLKKDKNVIYSTASSIGYAFCAKGPKFEVIHGQEGFSSISLGEKDVIIESILLNLKV